VSDASEHRAPDIRIVAGSPDAAEVAAITAVLSVALEQLAAADRRSSDERPSGWQRTRRQMRTPLRRGTWGAWDLRT
jgi:hypothetical protein